MKKTLSILFFFTVFLSTNAYCGKIIYPWRASTAIVKVGTTFEVWFNADAGQTVNSVELHGPYNNVSTTKNIVTGDWVYDKYSNNKYDTKITVTVPAGTPADRYDLILKTSTGDVTSTGAVKVIKTYKSDYYLLHMSDAHRAQGGYDENLILQKISTVLDIANIIDPEIIFETGDNQYNVINHPEREQSYFQGIPSLGIKGMNNAFAATFMTPGNHDTPGNGVGTDTDPLINSLFYNKYWGLQSYNFTYGDGRYMVMNNAWLGFDPTQQITDAAAWLTTVGTGNLRIGAFHGPSGARVDDLTTRTNMTAGIAGHVHQSSDNPWVNNVYTADDMRGSFAFNLYKINAVTGAWTPVGGPTAAVQALQNPADILTPALYKPNLTLAYLNSNDGTSNTNTATIVNKFTFPISGARVRFVVPKGFSYTVTNGTVKQEFEGTSYHIVDVATDLGSNSTKLVSIAKADVAVTSVTLTPTTATLNIGGTQQLTATVAPTNATNKAVSYSTSNATVATVNTSGLVSAVAAGTATITVTTQDGAKTASSVITVTVPVSGVTLTPATASLNVGGTKQLTAAIAPTNATNKAVSYSTSNVTVATVNTSGLVSAVAAGTATITVTTQDGAKIDASVITVTDAIITLQAEDATLNGAIINANLTGYHGTGFVNYVNNSGDYIQWTVNVPSAGSYDLTFRYALPSGGRPLELKVNGIVKVASLDFPATILWTTWQTISTKQTLVSGNNTIRLTTIGSNGGNIDELFVTPMSAYLDDCDVTTGWNTSGTNTLSLYSTDKKQGTNCIQMIGSGTDEFKKVFSPAYNSGATTANGVLKFWYYVSDVTKCGSNQVELGSGGAADVNEYNWNLSGLVNGWNLISLNITNAGQIGSPNLSAINWFRVYNSKSASITTRVDAIQVGPNLPQFVKGINTGNDLIFGQDGKTVNIYPNPLNQKVLSIDLTGLDMNNAFVKISNLSGQTVYQTKLNNTTHLKLDMSGILKKSIYIISVESGDTKVINKLIVQ